MENNKHANFLDEVESDLKELLNEYAKETGNEVMEYVRSKMIESYKNGLKSARFAGKSKSYPKED